MLIIAHRAQDVKEPIPQRFGVEIDVRGWESPHDLVLSHDRIISEYIAKEGRFNTKEGESEPWFILPWTCGKEGIPQRPMWAINIKEDGIEQEVATYCRLLNRNGCPSFVFDGSHPTMRRLKNLNVPVAERISEEEPYRGFSDIIWLDRWDWVDGDGAIPEGRPTAAGNDKCVRVPLINHKTGNRTTIYAVSPELHIPNCQPTFRRYWWRRFQEMGCAGICTDHWLEAEEFLND